MHNISGMQCIEGKYNLPCPFLDVFGSAFVPMLNCGSNIRSTIKIKDTNISHTFGLVHTSNRSDFMSGNTETKDESCSKLSKQGKMCGDSIERWIASASV
jgi:hypothetical protein